MSHETLANLSLTIVTFGVIFPRPLPQSFTYYLNGP